MKAEEAPRDYNMAQKVLNDAILALVGYCGGHLIACDYAYKHRQYIIQRIYFEKNYPNFDRFALKQQQGELPEYPFELFPWSEQREAILSDKYIIDDRIHPVEVRQNASNMVKRVEKYNDEYLNKRK